MGLGRDPVRSTQTPQGIEGTHVTYHPDYSPEDDDPLQGIRFIVSSPLGKFCALVTARFRLGETPHCTI